MKKLLIGVVLAAVVALVAAWAVAPVLAAQGLIRAAKAGDARKLEALVDFPSLRQSLKEELNAELVARMRRDPDIAGDALGGLGLMLAPMLLSGAVDTLVTPEMVAEMVKNIRPAKGKYAPAKDEKVHQPAVYTIEPDPDEVLDVLLPQLVNIAVFHALLEAKASEHSARMVAMKNATDKAKEMAHSLTRVFNKVRQAAITREVSEITSGIEAMR